MAKIKRWDLNVDGCNYAITFEFGGLKGTRLLKVNDVNFPIEKQHYKALIGVERPILLGNKECQFVLIGNKADVAVDGFYVDSKKSYAPFKSIPWWNWIFAAACIAIPIVALGGLLPVVIGLLGAVYCMRVSVSPYSKTTFKLLSCLGITVACWGLFELLILVMSQL
jgi:hypothetical protein